MKEAIKLAKELLLKLRDTGKPHAGRAGRFVVTACTTKRRVPYTNDHETQYTVEFRTDSGLAQQLNADTFEDLSYKLDISASIQPKESPTYADAIRLAMDLVDEIRLTDENLSELQRWAGDYCVGVSFDGEAEAWSAKVGVRTEVNKVEVLFSASASLYFIDPAGFNSEVIDDIITRSATCLHSLYKALQRELERQ